MSTRTALRSRRGFTITEVLAAIVIVSVGLLVVTGLSASSVKTAAHARGDAQYWADAQEVVDSVMALGIGVPTSGSTTLRGRSISWTVGSAATAPQQVMFVVHRVGYESPTSTVADTVIMYLAKPNPGP